MADPTLPRKRSGRPPLTSRTAILAAARDIGFAQLTVGAVTTRVGVKYSTFYRHYPTIDALVTELVDEVLDQVELPAPDTDDWRTYLHTVCAALFELFAGHPGLADATVGLATLPDRLFAVYGHISGLLLAAGFTAQDAALAANTALELVVAPFITTDDHDTAMIRRRPRTASPVALDQRVRVVLTEIIDDPPRDWTTRKIELLITGLTPRLPHPPTR